MRILRINNIFLSDLSDFLIVKYPNQVNNLFWCASCSIKTDLGSFTNTYYVPTFLVFLNTYICTSFVWFSKIKVCMSNKVLKLGTSFAEVGHFQSKRSWQKWNIIYHCEVRSPLSYRRRWPLRAKWHWKPMKLQKLALLPFLYKFKCK